MSDSSSYVGQNLQRREDRGLITGRTQYLNDLQEPRLLHIAIHRSPHAHARIKSIHTKKALAIDGVKAVFTWQDVEESDSPGLLRPSIELPGMKSVKRPMLAREVVRYHGEPVAVVIARNESSAQDGRDAISVRYETLQAVSDVEEAVEDGTLLVHDDVPGNRALSWEIGDQSTVQEVMEEADHVIHMTLRNQRLAPNPMEPRGALARYQADTGRLVLDVSTQIPHLIRLYMSRTLGLPENKIQVRAPAVGGAFGSKNHHPPGEAITAWCALQLERPVKWVANRTESFLSDPQGRSRVMDARLGLDRGGTIEAIEVQTLADLGAYISTHMPIIATRSFASTLSGQYQIPAVYCSVEGVLTHAVPIDAYRGAGTPEMNFVIERLVDQAADEMDLDPAEMRRRNFIAPDSFPYRTPHGPVYDSGNYPRTLEKLLTESDYHELRTRQDRLRSEEQYLGLGLSCFVEAVCTGPSKFTSSKNSPALTESSLVRFHPSGQVTVFTGTCDNGQGHRTTFSQVVADALGCSPDEVEVIQGDTDGVPYGAGTFSSRSATLGGNAVLKGCEKVLDKARRIAAHQLEVSSQDLEFEQGEFSVRGAPDRSISLQDVARSAYKGTDLPDGMELGLEASAVFDPENFTFPFGAHLAVVEVTPETGHVNLLSYFAVDDCGVQINPRLVEGQIHGGVVQGIGEALWEAVRFDSDSRVRNGSMMDYALPRAKNLPDFQVSHTETPCPHNPLGVKGCGEAGTTAAPAAVVNAVVDALKPFGVTHIEMPLTDEKVWKNIQAGSGSSPD